MPLLPSKILALNLRSGGGANAVAICQFLTSHEPDVLVLTEWRANAVGPKFVDWAKSREFSHACLNDGGTLNGVFVAARMPFEFETKTPASVRRSPGVLLLAKFKGWNLLASYFPQLYNKALYFSACTEIAKMLGNLPFLLVGDFNTGNQLTDRGESGSRYTCATHFDALTSEPRLVDLWRRTHGPDAREWTWVSHRNNGFRIDHAFANSPFIQFMRPSCHYDHVPRENRITDHSALIINRIGPCEGIDA
jgi:exodeoxyribonuclease III